MKREKQIRRLRHLIHKHDSMMYTEIEKVIEYLDKQIFYLSGSVIRKDVERYNAYKEIKQIIIDENVTSDEFHIILSEERRKRYSAYDNKKVNNLKETRDNKGVYVGGGGSNRNKVRYPKKARSKRTWKIFYKMFPYKAELDGWDGQKSTKVSK